MAGLDHNPLLKQGDKIPAFIKLRSGRTFRFDSPKIFDIKVRDIAHGLSMRCRFGGHTRTFFSIAQHSCEVARLMYMRCPDPAQKNDAGLVGLLHDAHEAFVGDMVTPMKMILGAPWAELERKAFEAVETAFDMEDLNAEHHALMKECDREMLYSDALRWGMDGEKTLDNGSVVTELRQWVPANFHKPTFPDVVAHGPSVAREDFLTLFSMFGGHERVGTVADAA